VVGGGWLVVAGARVCVPWENGVLFAFGGWLGKPGWFSFWRQRRRGTDKRVGCQDWGINRRSIFTLYYTFVFIHHYCATLTTKLMVVLSTFAE
jgi:hypothetical protein